MVIWTITMHGQLNVKFGKETVWVPEIGHVDVETAVCSRRVSKRDSPVVEPAAESVRLYRAPT